MITLNEIRRIIGKSQNPLIFFDDDPDGLISFLLVRKHFGKGKGVIVKGKPMLGISYLLSVEKYNPDLIIVLDKPIIEQEFVDKISVPIIWIDHHPVIEIKGVKYYNPRIRDKKDNRCISYWCYQLTKENLWLATVGCVADYQIPGFIKKFKKEYPDLLGDNGDQKEILFNSRLGRLIRIFSLSLKGATFDVNKNIDIISKANNPHDLLDGVGDAKFLLNKIEKIEKVYDKLLEQAVNENKKEKIVVFIYPSQKFSFSAELSNELLYRLPGRFIVVGREKEGEVKMSLRNPGDKKIKLPEIINKALIGLQGYGGGHDFAAGACVRKNDFEQFISVIKDEILK